MARFPDLAQKDDAADASQFLSRVGYVVLGLAAPASMVLHPLALFVLLPIGPETRGHGTHTLAAVWQGYLGELLGESGH